MATKKLTAVMSTSGMPGPVGPPGPPGPPGPGGGVNSWNTRQGEVVPEAGDYTSGMVNAVDIDSFITNTEIEELFR